MKFNKIMVLDLQNFLQKNLFYNSKVEQILSLTITSLKINLPTSLGHLLSHLYSQLQCQAHFNQ